MTLLRAILFLLALGCGQFSLAANDLAMPRIEVFKAKRELRLLDGDKLVKTYPVALGGDPVTRVPDMNTNSLSAT